MVLRHRSLCLPGFSFDIYLEILLHSLGSKRKIENAELILDMLYGNVLFVFHLKKKAVGDVILTNGRSLTSDLSHYFLVVHPTFNETRNVFGFFSRFPFFDTCNVTKAEER